MKITYNLDKYIDDQINFYTENHKTTQYFLDDFCLENHWETIKHKYDTLKDYIRAYFIEFHAVSEQYYEDFKYDMAMEFDKYVGHKVIARGKNLDWRGSEGTAEFILDDAMQLFYKLTPDCDKTFEIERGRGYKQYLMRYSSHDVPTGATVSISFRKQGE